MPQWIQCLLGRHGHNVAVVDRNQAFQRFRCEACTLEWSVNVETGDTMIYRSRELDEMHKKHPHSEGDVRAGWGIVAGIVVAAIGVAAIVAALID